MQQVAAEAGFRLQGMAEGVAEIEEGASPRLPLVLGHDLSLHPHRLRHRPGERRRVPGQHVRAPCLQPLEEGPVPQQAVFQHLCIAGAQLPHRQGDQHVDVRQHTPGLVEGPDQVLAPGGVDGGLAADGAVHLCQQRGGQLHEVDAALVDGRGKAGQVADHPAAQGGDHVPPVQGLGQQPVAEIGQALEALGLLPRGQDDQPGGDPAVRERRQHPVPVQPGHGRVRHHHRPATGHHIGQKRPGPVQQAGADPDLVGAVAQAHGHPAQAVLGSAHAAPPSVCCRSRRRRRAEITSSTVAGWLVSPVSMVRSASA